MKPVKKLKYARLVVAGAILALAAAGAFLLSFDVNLAGLDISSMAAVVSSIATALLINSGDE